MAYNSSNIHYTIGAGGNIASATLAYYMQDLARKFQIWTNCVYTSTTIGGRATAGAFGPFLKK